MCLRFDQWDGRQGFPGLHIMDRNDAYQGCLSPNSADQFGSNGPCRCPQAEAELRHYAETLEQRVAERTARLEQTVQSLEGVCYHVAHDLRAPLRAIEGFTNILLQQYATHLDAPGQDLALRISQAATRMDHLIRDLLDYGRLSHARLRLGPIALENQVAQALACLDDEIKRTGATVKVLAPLGTVWGNGTVLDQMLTNLLGNALKYTTPGIAPCVQIRTESLGSSLRLWIEDNGIGIAPEHHARIFGVFERLHRSEQYPGTGIGLAIVAKGAELMGGQVGVHSVEGQGSRFWIELKTASPESHGHKPQTVPSCGSAGSLDLPDATRCC